MSKRKLVVALVVATLALTQVFGLSTVGFADSIYPIKTDDTITVWMVLPGNVSQLVTNVGETPYMQALEAATGIKVEFLHPAAGQTAEALNLMLASGDMPDVIEYDWLHFTGGPSKLIEDGVLLSLNDAMANYMPNLSAYLAKNQDIDKMLKTDKGEYYVVPFLRGDKILQTSWGPTIRLDLLEKYGLSLPETIDEWEAALTTFKENGIEKPFSAAGLNDMLKFGVFTGAYRAPMNFFYNDEGKTTYGPLEPGFKDALTKLNQWYIKGLIDADIATNDGATVNAGILSGKIGASILSPGGGIGTLTTNARAAGDDQLKLMGTKYPVVNKGEMPMIVRYEHSYPGGSGSTAISATCKNVELASRWLDYSWSDQGHILAAFGTEGVSYTMVDGEPIYTDLILKNPDGLTVAAAMAMHCRSNYGGPIAQDARYLFQYMVLDEQKQSIYNWQESDSLKHILKPVTPTAEEAETISRLMGDIQTYCEEMVTKFVLGSESIDAKYDEFVNTVKELGIEQVLEIYDAATDRYNQR